MKKYFNLLISIGFAIILLILRIKLSGTIFYTFLIWNLFLAGLPYVISQIMIKSEYIQSSKLTSILGFIIWLLILPNSPYIITDLIHLHDNASNMAWYDLFLVFVFAINGLILGLLSMQDIFKMITEKFNKKVATYTLCKVCFLAGYGVYLGRFLRFNSWDVITNPTSLIHQVVYSVYDSRILITFAFGGLLWILFRLLQSIRLA